MKYFSIYQRKIHLWFVFGSCLALAAVIFLMPSWQHVDFSGSQMYTVTLNGTEVGVVGSEEEAERDLIAARRAVASGSGDLMYMKAELSLSGRQVLWGRVDDRSVVVRHMKDVLKGSVRSSLERCFTVKIGEYMVSLPTSDDVVSLLETALGQYDTDHEFLVSLSQDTARHLGGLTTKITTTHEQDVEAAKASRLPVAGINEALDDVLVSAEPVVSPSFDDYQLGLTSISFGKTIEVAESYLPKDQISDLASATGDVLQQNAAKQTYEVKSGDTLSQIAEDYGLSMDDLLAMNPNYADENAVIRVGDLITVTVPQSKLPIRYTKQEYYEEDYNEDTVYIDNNSWYTTKTEVVQEPSAGHRRVIADVTYEDDQKESSEIVKEEVTVAAVPKIVERGTQTPPTYVWPVSGGYVSSGFGARSRPKAGASTYHKGIDIACSVGSAVMASNGGTVSSAGWQSGYGYVVYIDHGNGVQTRYGHLSKILVRVGETVKQGERIALSGNTGNSTGPHCHFEIRMNGEAVNPLNYLN